MNIPILIVLLADFAAIGLLPRVFFKRGSFNGGWWLTALPFFCCPAFLVAAAAVGWRSWVGPGLPSTLTAAVAGVLATGSVALLALTLGTHRIPLALWHQDDDAPSAIVTYGAYARIRHPFYASFLLGLIAAVVLFPHIGTVLPLCFAVVKLNMTAAREERRLAASEFGLEYRAYVARTGRFLPARPIKPSKLQGAAMSDTVSEPEFMELLRNAAEKVDVDLSGATADTTLESLGMDSLTKLELVSILEDELSIRIPDEKLREFKTAGDLVSCLLELQAASPA